MQAKQTIKIHIMANIIFLLYISLQAEYNLMPNLSVIRYIAKQCEPNKMKGW